VTARIRSVAAAVLTLLGVFWMFNWFMLPKDEYFWKLNLWPFMVLPVSAGLFAWFLQPRSSSASIRIGKMIGYSYGILLGLFLLFFVIAFTANNTHQYW